MLTISAMVSIGPWMVEAVERDENWTRCERCKTPIKEIWVCSVAADYAGLDKLKGQRVWRIGSECGPTLEEMSKEHWDDQAKGIRTRLRLAKKVLKLQAAARARNIVLPPEIDEKLAQLVGGDMFYRDRQRLGFITHNYGVSLGLWKSRAR